MMVKNTVISKHFLLASDDMLSTRKLKITEAIKTYKNLFQTHFGVSNIYTS